MKFLLGSLLAVLALVFTACGPTETKVDVTVTPTDTSVTPGSTVDFSVVLTPQTIDKGELGAFTVRDNNDSTIYTDDFSKETNSKTVTVSYTVPETAVAGTTITLTFEAVDGKSGQSNAAQANITVVSGVPQMVTANNIQSTYNSTTLDNKMMFVLGSDGVTLDGGNSTDGDLAFVWQNDYGYSICSPNADWIAELFSYNGVTYTTSDKKITKIQRYNGDVTFDNLTAEDLDSLTVTTETVQGGGNGVQDLNEGDVIVFETQDGRKGALEVITNAKVTKNMTANLKYQATSSSAAK